MAVPSPKTVSSVLMKGEGVMSPVGLEESVWDAGLSLKVAVGRLTSPPGAVMVSCTAVVLVLGVTGLLR